MEVVGWTKNQGENEDMLAIDLLITVGNPAFRSCFLAVCVDTKERCKRRGHTHFIVLARFTQDIGTLTKIMHQAVGRTLGTRKLQFHYHFSINSFATWTWENPYGHYKPAWRYEDVDPEILREDPS